MLVSTVELYHRTKRAAPLGLIGVDAIRLDWPAIIDRKNKIVESWSKGTEPSLEKQGITILKGEARFVGSKELLIGDSPRRITADRFVIATGSSPAQPSIEGIENGITSNELLDLKALPHRMVVIGGGVIAMELGFCLARAGTRVTLLQKGQHLLPGIDADVRRTIEEIGIEAGMRFHTGINVKGIGADHTVEAEADGKAERFPADVALVATGRSPNIAGLDLTRAGVELNRGGIKVNEYLQSTSAAHVFAAGDVIGTHQHTPVAWYEGRLAAHNAVKGNEQEVDLKLLPTTVFTIPAAAQVGLSESGAREQGLKVAVTRSPIKENPAAGVRGEAEGFVKVVYEEATDRLLGIHVLSPGAEDLIQIAAVAMRGGLTRAQVGAMHYVFPTLGGAIFDAMAG